MAPVADLGRKKGGRREGEGKGKEVKTYISIRAIGTRKSGGEGRSWEGGCFLLFTLYPMFTACFVVSAPLPHTHTHTYTHTQGSHTHTYSASYILSGIPHYAMAVVLPLVPHEPLQCRVYIRQHIGVPEA